MWNLNAEQTPFFLHFAPERFLWLSSNRRLLFNLYSFFGKKTKLVVQRGDFFSSPNSERQNKNCDCFVFFESTIKDFILPMDFWSCRRKNPIAYCCSSSGNLFGWFGHYECLKMLCCPFMQSAVSRLSPPLLVLSKETGENEEREGVSAILPIVWMGIYEQKWSINHLPEQALFKTVPRHHCFWVVRAGIEAHFEVFFGINCNLKRFFVTYFLGWLL